MKRLRRYALCLLDPLTLMTLILLWSMKVAVEVTLVAVSFMVGVRYRHETFFTNLFSLLDQR